jgi:hypothetical protein
VFKTAGDPTPQLNLPDRGDAVQGRSLGADERLLEPTVSHLVRERHSREPGVEGRLSLRSLSQQSRRGTSSSGSPSVTAPATARTARLEVLFEVLFVEGNVGIVS